MQWTGTSLNTIAQSFSGKMVLKMWRSHKPAVITGIDVLAEKDGVTYAIQCKCYSDNVGNHAVQEAHSGASYYGRMVAAVMTNRYFTAAAKETAARIHVLLWDRDKLLQMQQTQNK